MCCAKFNKLLLLFSLTFLVGISSTMFFDSFENKENQRLLRIENTVSAKPNKTESLNPSYTNICEENVYLRISLVQKKAETELWLKLNLSDSVKERKTKKRLLKKIEKAIVEVSRRKQTPSEIIMPSKNGVSDLLYREGCS